MGPINVEGLPEPAVRALEVIVQSLRNGTAPTPSAGSHETDAPPRELTIVKGTVFGSLRRSEIYADVGCGNIP